MERDHATAHERGFIFDEEEAERAVRFFEKYCVLWEGEWAGKPFALSDFQRQNVREMYGWKHADSRYRRFREAYWEIARKNGKTSFAGAAGLKGLVQDNEPGAQVVFTATKRDQAMIGFRASAEMALQSPKLLRFVRVPKGYPRGSPLTCPRLKAKLGVLSSDHSTQDGWNPSTDIRDEIHEWKDRRLAAKLDTAKGARRQPFTLEITTAGVFDRTTYGWQRHDYATSVLNGLEDDRLFAYIAAADEGDDPFDPVTWWKANPGLGRAPSLESLQALAAKARNEPAFYNDFLRYHLNIWTAQVRRWLMPEDWAANDTTPIDLATLKGRRCFAALDLSRKLDLTSLVLVFPEEDGGVTLVPFFWIPEARVGPAGKSQAEREMYPVWVRAGVMEATPGNVVDYRRVRAKINELRDFGITIQEIAFDPFNATQLITDLQDEDGFRCVEFGQGYKSMSEPSKTFETLVVGHKLRTGGNPVMSWCAGNAVISTDPAGNIKPDKSKAAEKIDGIVAAIMAIGRSYAVDEDGPKRSYLLDGDLVIA
ncbi:MAG: terminase TerL endonuclease subunit [Deltaproteobacteria bacterium]